MEMHRVMEQSIQAPAGATSETAVNEAATVEGDVEGDVEPDAPRHKGFWLAVLSKTDTVVYVLVGIFFFLAALLSLCYGIGKFGYSLWNLAQSGISAVKPGSKAPTALIDFVSDLLLTLITMEVLGTVGQHLRYRETSLKPFLFIGIISATRGILAVGARLSITEGGALKIDDFRTDMVELGVN